MNNIITGFPSTPTLVPTKPTAPTGGETGQGFGATLKDAIARVDDLDQNSQTQVTGVLEGKRQDLHNVMIAVEKADVAFQLMMQVRNKIVNAYQEVSKLQF